MRALYVKRKRHDLRLRKVFHPRCQMPGSGDDRIEQDSAPR